MMELLPHPTALLHVDENTFFHVDDKYGRHFPLEELLAAAPPAAHPPSALAAVPAAAPACCRARALSSQAPKTGRY